MAGAESPSNWRKLALEEAADLEEAVDLEVAVDLEEAMDLTGAESPSHILTLQQHFPQWRWLSLWIMCGHRLWNLSLTARPPSTTTQCSSQLILVRPGLTKRWDEAQQQPNTGPKTNLTRMRQLPKWSASFKNHGIAMNFGTMLLGDFLKFFKQPHHSFNHT